MITTFKIFRSRTGVFSAIIIILLLTLIGYLADAGISYKLAFILVFTIFDLLVLTYIRKRLIETYGDSRAVKLFVYGLGIAILFGFILYILFQE